MAVSFPRGVTSFDRPGATNSSAALWRNEETHDAQPIVSSEEWEAAWQALLVDGDDALYTPEELALAAAGWLEWETAV
jgi:hypothetical protein